MEEADKGCLMIRMGVSGWMFLLFPAHLGNSGQGPLNSCVSLYVCWVLPGTKLYLSIWRVVAIRTGYPFLALVLMSYDRSFYHSNEKQTNISDTEYWTAGSENFTTAFTDVNAFDLQLARRSWESTTPWKHCLFNTLPVQRWWKFLMVCCIQCGICTLIQSQLPSCYRCL